MAAPDQPLPEGTDHVINGAGATGEDDTADTLPTDPEIGLEDEAPTGDAGATGAAGATGGAFFAKIEEARTQGYDKAREYAVMGKDRTTGALDDLIRMINDAAGQVDSKVGNQYGDYARRAADGLTSINDALKGKDVDQLFTDARDLVAKAPAVAVGTAAALGFVVARLAKASMDNSGGDDGKTVPRA